MGGDGGDENDDDGDDDRENKTAKFLFNVLIPNALLFMLVFGLSASVDIRDVRSKFKKKTGILVGLSCQFFLLPFIGAMVCIIGELPPIVGIPLLVVTSSPGGSYSNLYLALSVAMTTVSTVLSMGFLPLNLYVWITVVYQDSVSVPWNKLFVPLGVVIAAILGGLIISNNRAAAAASGARSLNPDAPDSESAKEHFDWGKMLNKIGNFAGILLILYSAYASEPEGWGGQRPGFYLAVMTPCLLGVILAFSISSIPCFRLVGPERTAVSIECCYQNVAIAQTVAFGMDWDVARAIKVPLFYAVVEIIALGIFVLICWQMNWTYAPRTDNFFKIIRNDYQDVQRKAKHKMWAKPRILKLLKTETPGTEGPLNKVSGVQKATEFKNVINSDVLGTVFEEGPESEL